MNDMNTKPSLMSSWPRVYALVCLAAVVYIALLYWFTLAFNNPGVGG